MKLCKIANESACGKKCCCHYCDEQGNCKSKCTVDRNELCEELFDCDNELEVMKEQSQEIIKCITDITVEKSRLDKLEEEMKVRLKQAMEQYNVKKFENELISVTYVDASTRQTVDSAKLKKDGLYEQYVKISNVTSSIRIKVK